MVSCDRHHGAVVKVVVPQGIEAVAALLGRANKPCLLRFVLAHHQCRASARRRPDTAHDRRKDMVGRAVEDLLRGVEPQAVEVEFIDPVAGVGEKKFAHRAGVPAVEIDGLAPLVLVTVREVVLGEPLQETAVRPHVVVNHIENHTQPYSMGPIDEAAEIVRGAVKPRGGEQIHTVVAPAESAGEIRYGHELEHGDADRCKLFEFPRRGLPRPLPREGPDMHLVEHLAFQPHAAPRAVGPLKRTRINDL